MRFLRSLAAIFMPPFEGLAFIVVVYFAWAHMVYPHNDVMRGNLPDPDDYMYLTQVVDWIQGQGWFDNVQHRLDPPHGTPIHFSRLAQLPIAAGVVLFKLLGLKTHGAALLTALIEPLILLGCCLWVLRRVASFVVPPRWAGASAYIGLFSVALLFEFMPGHVDHHGLVIVLILASVACILRLIEQPEDMKASIGAGLILAVALTIALECLPWVLLLAAWLGLWGMQQGGRTARAGLVFAAALATGTVICLALTRPPAMIFVPDVLTYSVVYVILAACIFVPFLGVTLADKTSSFRGLNNIRHNAPPPLAGGGWGRGSFLRTFVGITTALLCGILFLRRFPELATGPYGGIDPQLLPLLLNEMEEAKPILQTSNGATHILNFMSMSFIALPAALAFAWRARNDEKWKWSLIALLLTVAMALTIFYQYRFMGMTSALAVIPLTALLQRGWQWAGHSLAGRKKVLAEIGLLLLVGPLPAVIVPALFDSRSFNTGFLLFPVDSGHTPCDMSLLEHALRDPAGLGDRPHTIISFMELGPELLFRTEHNVLAAPFHMNVQGNLDAARFLSTPYPPEAEHIARRRGVDLVVVCRSIPGHYLGAKDIAPVMAERFFKGPMPDWLDPVFIKGLQNFAVYRVTPAQSSAPDANASQKKKNP